MSEQLRRRGGAHLICVEANGILHGASNTEFLERAAAAFDVIT
jgi:hypothetical protein